MNKFNSRLCMAIMPENCVKASINKIKNFEHLKRTSYAGNAQRSISD